MTAARMVYRVIEVAELLGVSDETVYRLIREGALRARAQRRFIVVTHDDLAAYVNALPIKEAPDAAPAATDPAVEPASLPARRVGGLRKRVVRLLSPIAQAAR